MKNKFILIIALSALVLFSLTLVSAQLSFTVNFASPTPNYLNKSFNAIVNITLNNTVASTVNITQVTIILPFGASFSASSNGTTSAACVFSNSSNSGLVYLTWTNTTNTFFPNNSAGKSFWFNATFSAVGTNSFSIVANDSLYAGDIASVTKTVNFAFSSYVKNETGGSASGVNVTLSQYIEGQNGPPTESAVYSTLTDDNGMFTFGSVNGSLSSIKIKMFLNTSDGNITKVGSILPDFPAMMYYPQDFGGEFEFMRPPSLNGTTFYLQPAATLRIGATGFNGVGIGRQLFGYEVVDQVMGFPIVANLMTNASIIDVVVPIGRSYSIMYMRMPFGTYSFAFGQQCNGTLLNDSTCPIPPVSNSTLGTLTAGQVLIVNQSLMTANYRLTGCIDIGAGQNNTPINGTLNITNIAPKMVPWPGFIPPISADRGDINVSTDVNYTGKGGCSFAFYNISVLGSASGINYLLEFYAKNASFESQTPGSTAWQLAAFQNLTITDHTNFNVTLYKLTGSYWSGGLGSVNTSKMRVNIQNSTGGIITNKMNANVKIKNTATGTLNYMIESMTNGTFYIPILNNSNWAKIIVMSSDSPPKEITLNLSVVENNITLTTMADGRSGLRKMNASGKPEMMNSSDLSSSMPIQMSFIRNSSDCSALSPSSDCSITSMEAKNFNPMKALVAGRVNMEMKIKSTNVTLRFMNFDMFSAKQPPMDSIMNENASSRSTTQQTWQFGSFAPKDSYDYVLIGMPYSGTVSDSNFFNDSAEFINITTPTLYDENWNTAWNKTSGGTSDTLPDDFIEYNASIYRNYLTTGGANCSKTDSSFSATPCYVNTTSNVLWMMIPHFSGVAPTMTATSVGSAGTTASTDGTTGGTTTPFWIAEYVPTSDQLTSGYSQSLIAKSRVRVIINAEAHYVGVVSLTSTQATINVSSTPQQAVFNIGDSKKFDVNEDNYYDVSVLLDSITGSKANVTIKTINEKMPASAIPAGSQNQPASNQSSPEATSTAVNSIWIWIVIAIVIIIAIVLVLSFSKKKRYYKKGY